MSSLSCSPICKSATYELLVTMGFPPTISTVASKLYLNDIEEAVNYCSEFLSSSSYSSLDSVDCCRKGENYKKCYDLLRFSHPEFLSLFERWFDEDQFEDAQLTEEFIENDDIEDSFFIQYIEDNIEGIPFNDHIAMQLFYDLQDSIRISAPPASTRTYIHCLLDGFIREMKPDSNISSQIPFKINLLIDRYYSKFSNEFMTIDAELFTNESLVNSAKQSYSQHCSTLFPSAESLNDALCYLSLVGNDNNLPFLTYLTDAYNRYRIQKATQRLEKARNKFTEDNKTFWLKKKRWKSKHRIHDASVEQFIRKHCTAFSEMYWFQDLCIQSVSALVHNCALGRAALNSPSIRHIEDNFIQVADCMLDSYLFVDSYVSTLKTNQMPLQFDVMIIPQSVVNEEEEHVSMTDDEDDIETLLQNANCKYERSKTKVTAANRLESMRLLTAQLMESKLHRTKLANERCCVLMDRRNDAMFVYQTGHHSDKIVSDREHFVNESLFDNSVRCLVPNLCGAKDPLNGYMLSLSFHVISKYETRVYLYLDGFMARFYVQDLVQYLPQFFQSGDNDSVINDMKKDAHQFSKFVDKYKKCENILTDATFDEFYQNILRDKRKLPYTLYNI